MDERVPLFHARTLSGHEIVGCTDGTFWQWDGHRWLPHLAPIPGSSADLAAQAEKKAAEGAAAAKAAEPAPESTTPATHTEPPTGNPATTEATSAQPATATTG